MQFSRAKLLKWLARPLLVAAKQQPNVAPVVRAQRVKLAQGRDKAHELVFGATPVEDAPMPLSQLNIT